MSMRHAVALTGALVAGACSQVDRSNLARVGGPQFAHTQDLEGTPDLIVDAAKLASSWVIYDQELKGSFCSLTESELAPGVYRVLRFTVNTPNVGDADVFIGSPWDHMDPNGDGDFSDSDGLYEGSACHRHFHFRNYALYQLIDAETTISASDLGFEPIGLSDHPRGSLPRSLAHLGHLKGLAALRFTIQAVARTSAARRESRRASSCSAARPAGCNAKIRRRSHTAGQGPVPGVGGV